MEAIIFAVAFPLILSVVQTLINKQIKNLEKQESDVGFCVSYPSIMGWVAIIGIVMGVALTAAAASDLDQAYWVLLIPFSFVIAGFWLLLKTYFWKIYVYGDSVTVLRPFRRPYTFSLEEILSVKRECKDKYSSTKERMLIRTTKARRISVESGAIGYSLLKEKLGSQLNCCVLWGF